MRTKQELRWRRAVSVCVAVVVIMWSGATASAVVVQNDAFHFTFAVPDGFVRENDPGDNLYAFRKDDPATGRWIAFINVQRMHGTIGRWHASEPTTKNTVGGRTVIRRWQNRDVDVFENRVTEGGPPMEWRAIHFPVSGEAIQVDVVVAAGHAAETDALVADVFNGFLASADGDGPVQGDPDELTGPNGTLLTALIWLVPLALLFTPAKRRRADGGPAMGETFSRSASRRRRIAVVIGLAVGVIAAVILTFGGIEALPVDRLTSAELSRRSGLVAAGAIRLSGLIVLLTMGVVRLVLRVLFGRVADASWKKRRVKRPGTRRHKIGSA